MQIRAGEARLFIWWQISRGRTEYQQNLISFCSQLSRPPFSERNNKKEFPHQLLVGVFLSVTHDSTVDCSSQGSQKIATESAVGPEKVAPEDVNAGLREDEKCQVQ